MRYAALGGAALARLAIVNQVLQVSDDRGNRIEPEFFDFTSVAATQARLADVDPGRPIELEEILDGSVLAAPRMPAIDVATGRPTELGVACAEISYALLVADFLVAEAAQNRIVKPFRLGWTTGTVATVASAPIEELDGIAFVGFSNASVHLDTLPSSPAWSIGAVNLSPFFGNAASRADEAVPGSLVMLAGTGLDGAGLAVTVGGTPMDIDPAAVAPTRIQFVLPKTTPLGSHRVVLRHAGGAGGFRHAVIPLSPGLFTANEDPRGPAFGDAFIATDAGVVMQPLAVQQQGAWVPLAMPRTGGGSTTILAVYGTGSAGSTQVTARVLSNNNSFPATINYAGPQGGTAGGTPGLDQVNLVLPAEVEPGPARVVIEVGGRQSNAVEIAVR
jgi:uncharacterized protein (TIGR03437 family)